MSAEVAKIIHSPDMSASLRAQAFEPRAGSPRELKAHIDKGLEQSAAIIKGAGFRLE